MLDSDLPVKLISEFSHLLKQQRTFFMKVKRTNHLTEQVDLKLKYFEKCTRAKVLSFPLITKLCQDAHLLLDNIVISDGASQGIASVMELVPTLLHSATFNSNSMVSQTTLTLLKGLQS